MKLHYFSSGPRERVLAAVLDAGHEVMEVIATDPEKWPRVRPTIDLAAEKGIPVRLVEKADLAGLAPRLSSQVCLSVGFGYLFPPELIDASEVALNVHGTLLPKYRGARTLNWVIAHGEDESGVTVHQIDVGTDTGPILLQRPLPVSIFDTVTSLQRRTLEFEPEVVVEALALYGSGRANLTRQLDVDVPQYPDRVPEHSEIDPTRPLIDLYDEIRAADPERFPAYFFVAGQKVCIRLSRPGKPDDELDMI
ncbi:MAG: hypothetical protein H0U55_00850 [Rubrobacteraceae bacterium]|nr:hypothetical protein [Rubrobacteraceae bacterium]